MSGELVLVTGGSGFIGAHCILRLLADGYQVRTTVRSPAREADVRTRLKVGGVEPGAALSFAVADLMKDAGWQEAVTGCDYVLHVASPFPPGIPKHEDELILPARDGTLRVLRAASDAGVKRVVLTSSIVAISYGHPPMNRPFTEEDWTDLEGDNVSAYMKSKTLAERAAWDFVAREGGTLELAVVNPVFALGPVLGPDCSTSIEIVKRLMDGDVPGCPDLTVGVVDVRDVADLHVRAMINPAANGERFLALAGDYMSIREIAIVLKTRMGAAAKRVSTRAMPSWLARLLALFIPALAQIAPELGEVKNASNAKAKRMLDWTPRTSEEAIVATAESMVRLGLLRDARKVV